MRVGVRYYNFFTNGGRSTNGFLGFNCSASSCNCRTNPLRKIKHPDISLYVFRFSAEFLFITFLQMWVLKTSYGFTIFNSLSANIFYLFIYRCGLRYHICYFLLLQRTQIFKGPVFVNAQPMHPLYPA